MAALWTMLALAACPTRPSGQDTGDETGTDTGSTGDTGGPSEIPAVCARWVGCTAEIDPGTAAMMASAYGEGGTCWQEDDAGQAGCIATCDVRLREYAAAFPDVMACRHDDILGEVEFTLGEAVFDPNGQPPWPCMGSHILPFETRGCRDVHDLVSGIVQAEEAGELTREEASEWIGRLSGRAA